MTLGGWVFMLGSVGFVVTLCVLCFCKVLKRPSTVEHLQSPHTITTGDEDT